MSIFRTSGNFYEEIEPEQDEEVENSIADSSPGTCSTAKNASPEEHVSAVSAICSATTPNTKLTSTSVRSLKVS